MISRSQNDVRGLRKTWLYGLFLSLLLVLASPAAVADGPVSVSGALDAVSSNQRTLVINNRRYQVPARVVFNGIEMEGRRALEYLSDDDHVLLILRGNGSSVVERINSTHN